MLLSFDPFFFRLLKRADAFFLLSHGSPACFLSGFCLLSELSPHCFQNINMELISWALNSIDTLFLTRRTGPGEPACPDGTYAAGYTRDSWETWRALCLTPMSIKDIEDVYLFGTVITGFLLIGVGITLVYRKIKKTETAVHGPQRLPVMIEMLGGTVGTQQGTISDLNRRLDTITEMLKALQGAGQLVRVRKAGKLEPDIGEGLTDTR